MKLLVTGGAGYIGSIVAQQLLAAGHEVTVLDNLERGHRDAVPEGAGWSWRTCSIVEAVNAALAGGFDGAMHFAALALVSESVSHPERYYRTNVGGTLNLLEAMIAAGVPRLVFSSTCAVYGQPDEVPIAESAVPMPLNAYGASKLAVDLMIRDFCTATDLGAVSLRYFNVAGASGGLGEDHDPETHLIPNILRARSAPLPRSTSTGPTIRRPTAPRSATTSTSRTWPRRTCSRSRARARPSTGSSTSATAAASRSAR